MALSAVSIAPDNPSIIRGETIHFIATPVGGTPSAYQWNVDSSNIGGADQSTYDYTPTTVGNHTVKCYALNGSNPVSETETVTVSSWASLVTYLTTMIGHLASIRKATE